ncbi:galactokinase [Neobacillus thermocopriae]|uniref:galactokinase n=1 Tax=Neobacillus thermocopriae TaxID=1215031 RepID=UPI002E1FBF1F|nr:galactokinase [Neobacillus thermocopriae]MED3622612.1 galactokinase [Neobacillus thermocopriae]MED3714297.1 galactokinase [Neobacillus thermocopriae]
MNILPLNKTFLDLYGVLPKQAFFAPGRINLIGEHTDYNGGHVFPCAITYGTYAVVRKREDQLVRLYSENFPNKGIIEFQLNELDYDKDHDWANYPKGMIRYIIEAGYQIPNGFECVIKGNIPNGAGLSSSASIELLTGVLLDGLFQLGIPRLDLIKIGKRVENEFIGVNSGIMDQFAIGMGKEKAGILLDCQTLKYEYAPIQLDHHKIIIMNTNKRRELADSKYNERRSECEEALRQLQQKLPIEALGQLSEQEFEDNKHLITNEVVRKRARHAVYENRRTLKALNELKVGNLVAFGQLMNQSHLSLRDDYEVTGIELDSLVEAAWQQPSVLGARMTGAGFGGCAIAIVANEEVENFIASVGAAYREKIGYEAEFYVANIGDGAKEMEMEAVDE